MNQITATKIMETSEPIPIQEDQDMIEFTSSIKKDLRIASYWSTFISIFTLAIMTFSFFGFSYILYKSYTLSGVPMSEIISEMPWQGYAFFLFIKGILIVLIFSSISLLLFSFEVKKAVDYENSNAMDLAIELLLKFFRYNGILICGIFTVLFSVYLYFKTYY